MSLRETFGVHGPHIDDHLALHRQSNSWLVAYPHSGLQAVMDDAIATGRVLYLSPGTYNLGSTGLVANGALALVGSGPASTVLCYTGTGAALTLCGSQHTHVRGIGIDGLGTGATGVTLGVVDQSSLGGTVQDVYVRRVSAAGWMVNKAQLCTLTNCRSNLCGGAGFLFADPVGGSNTMCLLINCVAQENGLGMHIRDVGLLQCLTCTFENSRREGLLVEADTDNIINMAFRSCLFEHNALAEDCTAAIRTTGTGRYRAVAMEIDNAHFTTGTGKVHVSLDHVRLARVVGNSYENPSADYGVIGSSADADIYESADNWTVEQGATVVFK